MINSIAGVLLPAVVTVLLGYFAARRHQFGPQDAPVLIRMVMSYALPLSLFVGTVSRTRAQLASATPLLVVLLLAVVGLYAVVFVLSRIVLRRGIGVSALSALAAASPNVAFFGPVVLGNLYGMASGIPIAIGSIVNVLTVMPATVILLEWNASQQAATVAAPATAPSESASGSPGRVSLLPTVLSAARQSIVWFPALGVALVLLGLTVPPEFAASLELLGQSATGVALFAAGIAIAAFRITIDRDVLALVATKNVVQPALLLAALTLLGYGNPLRADAVISTALPSLVALTLLGVQYQVAAAKSASVLLLSMASSLVTLAVFISLTGA
jgi:malonate transporter